MTNILTKDLILQADDRRTQTVEVPEWGGAVIVKTLSGTERDQFEESILAGGKREFKGVRAKLVALSIIGEDGERLFTFEEAELLGEKSSLALDRVFGVAQRMSGFTTKDMEELAENLPEGQS